MTEISEALQRRLWSKIQVGRADECWPFTGYRLKGYGRIGLGTREAGVTYAHRLVTELAHGPYPPGHSARHLCGNRACCNPRHLAWGDQSANERDKIRHGLSNRGTRHGMAKLAESDVHVIRARYAAGESQSRIACDSGVRQQTISDIVTGRTWGWLASGPGSS